MAIDHKILIFSEESSPRLKYVMDLIVNSLWGLQWEISQDFEVYEKSPIGFINYSHNVSDHGIQVIPFGLLFQNDIKKQSITMDHEAGMPIFFQGDFFSMIFYQVSRYVEYLPYESDSHGRFSAKESLAKEYGFLDCPIVQIWAQHLKQKLLEKYPFIKFKKRVFRIQPSYDIDIAWAYKNKGLKRQLGGTMRDFLGKGTSLSKRIGVLLGKEKDPFNSFDYLDKINHSHDVLAKYFILIGEYGEFDKNTAFNHPEFQILIKRLAEEYPLGIHPSYQSNDDFTQLKKEKLRLESMTKNKITFSRQHYLKLTFPTTYHRLLRLGIQEDYSMGYQDALGFRAGLAIPFYWYDLTLEKVTGLKIYPFQVMDVTMKEYLKLSIDEAKIAINDIQAKIEKVGGDFVYIWHNSSFHPDEGWEGWEDVLEFIFFNNTKD